VSLAVMLPIGDPGWPVWLALGALGAALALDEHSLLQTWLSQPLPAVILAGLVVGDPAAGLVPGALMQLAVLGNLPVGASFRLDPGSAAVGVTAGAMLAGGRAPAVPVGLETWTGASAAALGVLVALFALASLAGGWAVHLERRLRLGWMLGGYRSARDGDLGRLERLHGRCLVVTAMRGGLLTLVWTVVVLLAWRPVLDRLPGLAAAAFALLPLAVPALAAGTLLDRFGYRRSLPLVGVGAGVGFLVALLAA